MYSALNNTLEKILTEEGVSFKKLELGFKKFVEKENLPESLSDSLKYFNKSYTDFKAKKLIKAESDKVKREVRTFIRTVTEHVQRKKFFGIERAKIKFKHAGKVGELLMLTDQIFIIKDLKQKDKIQKADIIKGKLTDLKDSNRDELDKTLIDVEVPQSISLTTTLFEDLKKIIGKDIELLL